MVDKKIEEYKTASNYLKRDVQTSSLAMAFFVCGLTIFFGIAIASPLALGIYNQSMDSQARFPDTSYTHPENPQLYAISYVGESVAIIEVLFGIAGAVLGNVAKQEYIKFAEQKHNMKFT